MVVIFAMVCMTTIDVVMRKISSLNIMGSYELTEMGMLVAIWIAIGYYQIIKGHIRVTMFIDMMPKRARMFMDIVAYGIGAVLMIFCIYGGILRVMSDISRNLCTAVLYIPQFPFSIIMVIGECLFFLLLLIDCITAIVDFGAYKKSDSLH